MAGRNLKRIYNDKTTLDRLKRHNISTCQDLLSKSQLELMKFLGQSQLSVNSLIQSASKVCAPKHRTALHLLKEKTENTAYLKTSLKDLDKVLHGGLPVGTITEISGPSGCGKTQFSLMLSVISTVPPNQGGLGGAVIFIDTESAFSAERLVEIANTKYPLFFPDEESLLRLSSKVHVYTESTCSSLWKRLESLEEDIITKGIKLIVVDSIASLVRKEFDSRSGKNSTERVNLLTKQAALLKYIAEEFQIPVVVTNQITTRYSLLQEEEDVPNEDDSTTVPLSRDRSHVTAALGNTWSHSVNTRLLVQYLDGPRRQVMVAKSPIAPFATFVYRIKDCGIELEEDGSDLYDGTDPGLQTIRVRSSIKQDAFMY